MPLGSAPTSSTSIASILRLTSGRSKDESFALDNRTHHLMGWAGLGLILKGSTREADTPWL